MRRARCPPRWPIQTGSPDFCASADYLNGALEPLRAVAPAPNPPGVTLKPIEPEDYRAVYRAWKEAFAGIWTSTPESEADYQRFLANNIGVPDRDPALYQVAWIDGEVAGLVFACIQRGTGTIPEVAVRPAWQRRGIARALLAAALQGLYDRGMTQVRLATDAADGRGARSLYEGFVCDVTKVAPAIACLPLSMTQRLRHLCHKGCAHRCDVS